MSELIVLGLIPGTHIQITFILWVLLVATLTIMGIVSLARRTHILRNWIISVRLLMLMRQSTIARQ
jgi:hypothetical protein